MRKYLILLIFLLPLALVGAQGQTLEELARSNPDFSTLIGAVDRVDGLAEALADPDAEYTLFAPTNSAFEAIPPALLSSPPSLQAVLNYHVVAGKFSLAEIAAQKTLPTLLGAPLTVTVAADGTILLNGTIQVTEGDLEASNGVIHAIDGVLLPERPSSTSNSLADVIANTEDLAFLNTALSLAPALQGVLGNVEADSYTIVFAPNDEAFTALDADLRTAAIADPALLGSILLYHWVVDEEIGSLEELLAPIDTEDDVTEKPSFLSGAALSFSGSAEDGQVLVNESALVLESIPADNGVLVIIDQVLIPDEEFILSAEDFASLIATLAATSEATEGPDLPQGPALDANWSVVAGGFSMAELDSADDFFVKVIDPFASGEDAELFGIEIINWTAEYQYTSFIVRQFLPAEVLIWMAEQDPSVWENISIATLKALPATELEKLPAEVQARAR